MIRRFLHATSILGGNHSSKGRQGSFRKEASRRRSGGLLRLEPLEDRRMLAVTLDVGDHLLAPDATGQLVDIYVGATNPGDGVSGANVNAQIDAGVYPGGYAAPMIEDLVLFDNGGPGDYIFDNNNNGANDLDNPGVPDQAPWWEGRTITTGSGDILPNGLLGTLSFTTEGYTSGSWHLIMSQTVNGPTSFPGMPIDVIDGTITISTPPVAVPIPAALPGYTVAEGMSITLDGTESYDPEEAVSFDGRTLNLDSVVTYEWDLDGDGVFGETGDDALRGDEVGAQPTFNAVGTGGQNVTVELIVYDTTGLASDPTSVGIRVLSVAPSIDGLLFSKNPINENDELTVYGAFSHPGSLDDHTVMIDWGDGTQSPADVDEETMTFEASHIYPDDAPTDTLSDTFTVVAALSDFSGLLTSASKTLTVHDVPPEILGLELSSDVIDEGDTLTVSGAFEDEGPLDTHTAIVYWGDGTTTTATVDAATRTFTADHIYQDDRFSGTPYDFYPIAVTVIDDDGGEATVVTTVQVDNVAPEVGPLELTQSEIDENGEVTVFGSYTDVGVLDTHTVEIDWGDGTTSPAAIDPVLGTFTATHQYLDDNPDVTPADQYTITATVTDDDTGVGTAFTTVTVNNVAPVISPLQVDPSDVNEGGSVTVSGSFTDVGTLDTHTVTVTWGDGTLSDATVDPVHRTFTATHTYADDDPSGTSSDTYTISATVTDDDSGTSDAAEATVTVHNLNPSITLTTSPLAVPTLQGPGGDFGISVAHTTINENDSIVASGTVSDPSALDVLTVVIDWGDGTTSTPAVDPVTGEYSATHQYLDENPSGTSQDTYTVTATVTDDDGGEAQASSPVAVQNVAPEILSLTPSQSEINENDTITVTGTFTDIGSLDTHTVTIQWGDGTSSPATVDEQAGTFTATHQYLDDDPSGTGADTYTITAILSDDDLGQDTATTSVEVSNLAPVLELTTPSSVQINENDTLTIQGTLTDVGTLDTHTVDIDWGDGSPVQTLTVAPGSFSFSHQYLDDNPTDTPSDTYTVSITARDDDTGTSSTLQTTVQVDNVAPVIDSLEVDPGEITENDTVTLRGTVSDVGTLDTHTVDINWGDGSEVQTVTVTEGAFEATHQYLDDNPSGTSSDEYTITVTATDDDTGTGTATTSVTVANAPPVLGELGLSAGESSENDEVTLTGSVTDVGTLDTHEVDIDWGDGSALETVTVTSGAFTATHRYLDDTPSNTSSDDYTITVTARDDDGGQDSDTLTVTVDNVDPVLGELVVDPDPVVENGIVSLTGSVTDVGTLDTHTVDIDWGDGSGVETVTVTGGAFGATHQYLDDTPSETSSDEYTITVTAHDDDGGSHSVDTSVTVENASPVLAQLGVTPDRIPENGEVTVGGLITDVGTLDTHTVDIDWGDGSLVETVTVTSGSFSATHRYLDDTPSGTPSDDYTITVTARDDDGGTATDTLTVTVDNVAPTVTLEIEPVETTSEEENTINEGDWIEASGVVSDVGTLDTHTLTIDWGDGSTAETVSIAPDGSYSAMHQYLDDNPTGTPVDPATITVTVTDDDGGIGTASDSGFIANVAPMIDEAFTVEGDSYSNPTGPISVHMDDASESVDVGWTFTDPGVLDTFTAVINWGDGTVEPAVVGSGTISGSHIYGGSGLYSVTLTLTDDDTGQDTHTFDLDVTQSQILGRHVFYNNSKFDGNDPGAGTLDDAAIAPDKSALLPGETATFENYTSYAKGLNGIMVDINGVSETPTIGDFLFKVGNDSSPTGWADAPAPASITLRSGAGIDGSDRITIIWADNDWHTEGPDAGSIANQWLEVTVLGDSFGLVTDDVFYFGNAIGETGNSPADTVVNADDQLGVRANPHYFLDPAAVDDVYDFDRDTNVDATDEIIARENETYFLNDLELITPPGAAPMVAPLEMSAPAPTATLELLTIELPLGASTLAAGADAVASLAGGSQSDSPSSGSPLASPLADADETPAGAVFGSSVEEETDAIDQLFDEIGGSSDQADGDELEVPGAEELLAL